MAPNENAPQASVSTIEIVNTEFILAVTAAALSRVNNSLGESAWSVVLHCR